MESADVKLVQSGPAFEIWSGPKGTMRIDWTKRGAVRLIVKGHGYGEFAAPALKRFDEAARNGQRIYSVADFWDMNSYDSPFRQQLQEWGNKHKKEIQAVIVASTSKLVNMGVSVANLAMGVTMKAHSRRVDFDRECQTLGLPLNVPLAPST